MQRLRRMAVVEVRRRASADMDGLAPGTERGCATSRGWNGRRPSIACMLLENRLAAAGRHSRTSASFLLVVVALRGERHRARGGGGGAGSSPRLRAANEETAVARARTQPPGKEPVLGGACRSSPFRRANRRPPPKCSMTSARACTRLSLAHSSSQGLGHAGKLPGFGRCHQQYHAAPMRDGRPRSRAACPDAAVECWLRADGHADGTADSRIGHECFQIRGACRSRSRRGRD